MTYGESLIMEKCEITKDELETWLPALRSGNFKQTVGRLFSGKGYCCLGVYFKSMGEKLKKSEQDDGMEMEEYYKRIEKLIGRSFVGTLIGLNDDKVPFNKIADVIEEKFKDVLRN